MGSKLPARCIRLLCANLRPQVLPSVITLHPIALGHMSALGFPRPASRRISVQARTYPQAGFNFISLNTAIEEERLPGYNAGKYYPVRLGEVFNSRYQTVAKLGAGGGSTVWLSRDLQEDKLVALKVCTTDDFSRDEIEISDHLKAVITEHDGVHLGQHHLRLVEDSFEVQGPGGLHLCLVHAPLGVTFQQFRSLFDENDLPYKLFRETMIYILLGVDFMHQAGIVHTDLSPNNILLGVSESDIKEELPKVEQAELNNPGPRKVLPDRTIYLSYQMPLTDGKPIITDFGAARIGEPGQSYSGDVMPGMYRAPEVVIGADWDSKIDIWSIGVMIWDLFEGTSLFRAEKDGHLDDETQLAEMVSLLGPPPKKFLEMNGNCKRYWDAEGNWIATTPIPDQSLESRETRLEGKEKEMMMTFVRKMLCWLPEDRWPAEDLYNDEFLVYHLKAKESEGHDDQA